MDLLSTIAESLWSARTPFVLLAFFVTRALVRSGPPIERYHLRAAATLLFGHIVATAIGAGQEASGYDGQIADIVSFAFELLAILTLTVTALFRALLPRVGFTLPRILIDLLTAFGVMLIRHGVTAMMGNVQ